MRHDLLALILAVLSLAITAGGRAEPAGSDGVRQRQACVTQIIRTQADGKPLTKRVRLCR